MTIAVAVAEDSLLVRQGIEHVLASADDIEITSVSHDLVSLLAAVDAHPPDVVLSDIRMPPSGTDEGIRAAVALRASHPDVGVVVLSHYAEPAYALDLLESGSRGRAYLLKERLAEPGQLVSAIRQVAGGGSVVDPAIVDLLIAARSRRSRSPVSWLSPRELEVLGEIAQGKSNGAVARSMGLSVRAVEKHINSLFSKLGLRDDADVSRRVKAVLVYLAAQDGRGRPAVAADG